MMRFASDILVIYRLVLIDIGLRLGQADGALVKRATDNDAFDTRSLDRVELNDAFHVGNTARGDHRNADRFRQLSGGFDIDPPASCRLD